MLEVTVNEKETMLSHPFLLEWSLRLTQFPANRRLYFRFFMEALSESRFSRKG